MPRVSLLLADDVGLGKTVEAGLVLTELLLRRRIRRVLILTQSSPTLRLADYDLDHDDRARSPQPVAPRLGDRFLPWQLAQGVEESWDECRRHAETSIRRTP